MEGKESVFYQVRHGSFVTNFGWMFWAGVWFERSFGGGFIGFTSQKSFYFSFGGLYNLCFMSHFV